MKTHYQSLFKKSFLTLVLLPITLVAAFAQTTIKGVVTDAKRKDAMPYVTVQFNGTSQGVSTNMQGQYTLTNTGNNKQIKQGLKFGTAVKVPTRHR